jgi:hypothetical protein
MKVAMGRETRKTTNRFQLAQILQGQEVNSKIMNNERLLFNSEKVYFEIEQERRGIRERKG